MRWGDERYVRVYTRDTGDWLALSFEAQALFLMLLRKVDRIGEVHLGRRGRSSMGALVGHPEKSAEMDAALGELLDDGCVRLSDAGDLLLVPNFLRAQETPKSPTERKREQRERDAAQALETIHVSRNVTRSRDGHEMSPRAVLCRAVPPEPIQQLLAGDAFAPPPGEAPARPARNRQTPPAKSTDPRRQPLIGALCAVFLELRGEPYGFDDGKDGKAVNRLLGRGPDEVVLSRWRKALSLKAWPGVATVHGLNERWNDLAGTQVPPVRGRDPRRAPVAAEDIPRESFKQTGQVNVQEAFK